MSAYPFEDELLTLKENESCIHIIRGRAFVIRPAADDDYDNAVVLDPFEQPRGEGPK